MELQSLCTERIPRYRGPSWFFAEVIWPDPVKQVFLSPLTKERGEGPSEKSKSVHYLASVASVFLKPPRPEVPKPHRTVE